MSEEKHSTLTEEKMRKIVTGSTVAGVLLVLFLVVILIIQFVQIGVTNRRQAELDAEIAHYEELIANGDITLAQLEKYETLRELAIELGWK